MHSARERERPCSVGRSAVECDYSPAFMGINYNIIYFIIIFFSIFQMKQGRLGGAAEALGGYCPPVPMPRTGPTLKPNDSATSV